MTLVSITLDEDEQGFLLSLGAVCGSGDIVPLSIAGKITRAREDLWTEESSGES